MVVAFERGKLVCEVGGDGTGLTSAQANDFAHEFRAEFPAAVVAILPSKKSWHGGWPWQPPTTPLLGTPRSGRSLRP